MRKLPLYIFLATAIFSIAGSCDKPMECLSEKYNFKATWNVVPGKDSLNTGDTLLITSVFPNHPFDYGRNMSVDFSGDAKFNTTMTVYTYRPGATNFTPAVDSFEFIPVSGSVYTVATLAADRVKQIDHKEYGNEYRLVFKAVPKKPGIYVFAVADGLGFRKSGKPCQDDAAIAFSHTNANNHLYLVQPLYGSNKIPESDSLHTYCFKVK